MKKTLLLLFTLSMAFTFSACVGSVLNSGNSYDIKDDPASGTIAWTFDAAEPGSTMYEAGAAITKCWTNNVPDMMCSVRTSTGSFQNVQEVAGGDADVALAMADVVSDGFKGVGKFGDIGQLNNLRVIGAVYADAGDDAEALGVKCLLIVNLDADISLVYALCKAMNENAAELAAENALLRDMADPAFLCTQMPIPLHPGAERYFSEIGVLP